MFHKKISGEPEHHILFLGVFYDGHHILAKLRSFRQSHVLIVLCCGSEHVHIHICCILRNKEENMRSFERNILVPDYSEVFADKVHNKVV